MKNVSPRLLIVTPRQTVYSDALESAPGSISQCGNVLPPCLSLLQSGTPVLLIGHITKEGSIAGPKILEHIVDAVLQFEGDQHYMYRVLRGIKTGSVAPPS